MQRHLRSVTFSSAQMHPRFDFSSYYLNEALSDVTLLIRIYDDISRVVQRLPAHGVVLANGRMGVLGMLSIAVVVAVSLHADFYHSRHSIFFIT